MLAPEPTAQEKAQAMAAALRGRKVADVQRQAGLLGQLTGDRVLAPLGHSLMNMGQQGYARADTEDRNQAMAQYHRDLITARMQPKPPDMAITTTPDGVTLGVDKHDPTAAPRVLHTAMSKLGKGGGSGAGTSKPEAPVTLETAAPWEVAAAKDYIKTKQLPPLGKDIASKKRIMALSSLLNGDGGVAETAAGFGADKSSLGHIQQQADAVNSFTRTFDKNINILEDSLGKLNSSNSPFANKGLRWLQSHATGDPSYTAFVNSLNTVRSELGKINSGSTGAGGVPISLLQEMEHGLPEDATPAQIAAALKVYRKDSENRRAAMDEQLTEIHGRMSGKKAAPASEPGASLPRKVIGGKTYEKRPDGWHEVLGG